MAALHLISRSPADSRALEQCLARAGEGDAVLLIEDGVYAAAEGSGSGEILRAATGRVMVYVLMPDLEARGLDIGSPCLRAAGANNSPPSPAPALHPVDYRGFVNLTASHRPVVSWF